MRNFFRIISSLLIVLLFYGCTDSNVRMIQESTLRENSTKTIKDTFDIIFKKSKWESYKENGEVIVAYTGIPGEKMHSDNVTRLIQYDEQMLPSWVSKEDKEKYQLDMKPHYEKINRFRNARDNCEQFQPNKYYEGIFGDNLSEGELAKIKKDNCEYSEGGTNNYKMAENEFYIASKNLREKIINNYLSDVFPPDSFIKIEWVIMPGGDYYKMKSFMCEYLPEEPCRMVYSYIQYY